MSSSDVTHPRGRRRLKWLLIAAVVLVAGYGIGWYVLATRVQSEFDRALANLNRDGVIAQCANREVQGFPFSIGISCTGLTYEDDSKATYGSTGAIESRAHIADPLLAVVEVDGPLRLQAPSLIPIWLDWRRLAGDVRYGSPLPKRVFLEGEGLAGQSDPEDESSPEQLFNIASLNAWIAPQGNDLICAGAFNGLEIAAAATGGRVIPVVNGKGEATVLNGVAAIASRANSFRGQSVEIKSLALTSGDGGVELSGPLSVGQDGLIDAALKVTMRDPQALSAILQTAVPEHADDIRSGLGGVALLGKDVTLPLAIARGRMMLGPIMLGEIPPLD